MRKILIFILTLMLLMGSTATGFGGITAGDTAETKDLYSLVSSEGGGSATFYNYVDGYSLSVPSDIAVDMSYSAVGSFLENSSLKIEIYKQPIGGIGKSVYMNYSNKFIYNSGDHRVEFNGTQPIAGREVHLLSWSRAKLERIENDKNYYLTIEIPQDSFVYTVFMKGNKPLGELWSYNSLVESFTVFEPTKSGYIRTGQAVDMAKKDWNDETKAFYKSYFSPEATLTWGIFNNGTDARDYGKLDSYEKYFGYKFPVVVSYTHFQKEKHPTLQARLEEAFKRGKVTELTLQTTDLPDGTSMVYDILNGEYDFFLAEYAKTVADYKHPVLLRLFNEMNGDWCSYSSYHYSKDTDLFKTLYTYVYGFFEDAGAKNVILVWNPNCDSFPNFKWNHSLMYYPGDAYADVVGMTAYNTGVYYHRVGERWIEFAELYDNLYASYCQMFNQPLMITEFASASAGGDKNQWIIRMFEEIKKYDRLKIAIWWDGCDYDNGKISRSYVIDENREIMDTFRRFLKVDWKRDIYA